MTPSVLPVLRKAGAAFACVTLFQVALLGQTTAPPQARSADVMQDILEQLRQLRAELDEVRVQLGQERRDSAALRQELTTLRESLGQDQALVNARVEEHEQTKVESGSKYHVRFSGLVLLNLASIRGHVDSIDLPLVAGPSGPADPNGSFTASVRQSYFGFEVFGPRVGGAKTSGDMSIDFLGGFAATRDGLSAPHLRLKTANVKLEWPTASVVAGQDAPFFSPQSPTSLLSTAYPSMSSSGNLWTWTPQVYGEWRHRLSNESQLTLAGGILDPFTGEFPADEYDRLPTAGEGSGLPAVAMHAGFRSAAELRPVTFGVGTYYSSQDWGFGRTVGAWAATADWDVPLGRVVAVSGEFYKGRAIGGLGGGVNASVLFDGLDFTSPVVPIESTGGWLQVKVAPSNRLEFNGAWGGDRPSCSAAPRCSAVSALDPGRLRRNATASMNGIYQVRSNLLVSLEYRRLWTTRAGARRQQADHFSLSTGIAF